MRQALPLVFLAFVACTPTAHGAPVPREAPLDDRAVVGVWRAYWGDPGLIHYMEGTFEFFPDGTFEFNWIDYDLDTAAPSPVRKGCYTGVWSLSPRHPSGVLLERPELTHYYDSLLERSGGCLSGEFRIGIGWLGNRKLLLTRR